MAIDGNINKNFNRTFGPKSVGGILWSSTPGRPLKQKLLFVELKLCHHYLSQRARFKIYIYIFTVLGYNFNLVVANDMSVPALAAPPLLECLLYECWD